MCLRVAAFIIYFSSFLFGELSGHYDYGGQRVRAPITQKQAWGTTNGDNEKYQRLVSVSEEYSPGRCPLGATGHFHYAPDCKRFLNCWKGRALVQICAPGTLFNPETLECDHPSKVKCLDEDGYQNEQVPQPMLSYVRFPDERPSIQANPRKFQGGSRGGSKNIYSEDISRHSTKDPGSKSLPVKQYDNQKLPVACAAGSTGHFPHPYDCTKFLHCWDGRTFVKECGPGTAFNPAISVCDHPHHVKCPPNGNQDFGEVDLSPDASSIDYDSPLVEDDTKAQSQVKRPQIDVRDKGVHQGYDQIGPHHFPSPNQRTPPPRMPKIIFDSYGNPIFIETITGPKQTPTGHPRDQFLDQFPNAPSPSQTHPGSHPYPQYQIPPGYPNNRPSGLPTQAFPSRFPNNQSPNIPLSPPGGHQQFPTPHQHGPSYPNTNSNHQQPLLPSENRPSPPYQSPANPLQPPFQQGAPGPYDDLTGQSYVPDPLQPPPRLTPNANYGFGNKVSSPDDNHRQPHLPPYQSLPNPPQPGPSHKAPPGPDDDLVGQSFVPDPFELYPSSPSPDSDSLQLQPNFNPTSRYPPPQNNYDPRPQPLFPGQPPSTPNNGPQRGNPSGFPSYPAVNRNPPPKANPQYPNTNPPEPGYQPLAPVRPKIEKPKFQLSGEFDNGGYLLTMGSDKKWGLVCADPAEGWGSNAANVICKELGFPRGAEWMFQGFQRALWDGEPHVAAEGIKCFGQGVFEDSCEMTFVSDSSCLIEADAVGVRCYDNPSSTCKPGDPQCNKPKKYSKNVGTTPKTPHHNHHPTNSQPSYPGNDPVRQTPKLPENPNYNPPNNPSYPNVANYPQRPQYPSSGSQTVSNINPNQPDYQFPGGNNSDEEGQTYVTLPPPSKGNRKNPLPKTSPFYDDSDEDYKPQKKKQFSKGADDDYEPLKKRPLSRDEIDDDIDYKPLQKRPLSRDDTDEADDDNYKPIRSKPKSKGKTDDNYGYKPLKKEDDSEEEEEPTRNPHSSKSFPSPSKNQPNSFPQYPGKKTIPSSPGTKGPNKPGQEILFKALPDKDPLRENIEEKESPPSGQNLRLRKGAGHTDGMVEIRGPGGKWGLVCDDRNDWTLHEGSIVCKELGFERGAEWVWQGYPPIPWDEPPHVSADKINCAGDGSFTESCNVTHVHKSFCKVEEAAVGVRCYNNVASTCQPGEVHLSHHCYSLHSPTPEDDTGVTLFDAFEECYRIGGHLLDLTTQTENDYVSEWLLKSHPNVTEIMTAGVGVTFMGMPMWVWQGTDAPMLFQKWWTGWSNERPIPQGKMNQPVCLVIKRKFPCPKKNVSDEREPLTDESVDMQNPSNQTSDCVTDYFFWDAQACETLKNNKLPYICERPMIDVGCVEGKGESYNGTANTTASGLSCLHWDDPKVTKNLVKIFPRTNPPFNLSGHNFCRSLGKSFSHPSCFVEKKDFPVGCDIPHCYATGTGTSSQAQANKYTRE